MGKEKRSISTSELRPFYSWGTATTPIKSYNPSRKTIDGLPENALQSDFIYVAHNKAQETYGKRAVVTFDTLNQQHEDDDDTQAAA